MSRRSRKAAASTWDDLNEKVKNEGSAGAYEALQLYRSRATRCKTKGDAMGAILIAANGSKCLLENTYETAGAELAMFFVELISEHNNENPTDNDSLKLFYDHILGIDEKFPSPSSGTLRSDFLKACVKWSVQTGPSELGDSTLHTRLALELWRLKDKNATSHFVAAENPTGLCKIIFETFSEPGPEQQLLREKALTLGVVHFVAAENLRDGFSLLRQFQKKELASPATVAGTSLTAFCDYLLQTCRRDAAPLFKSLVNSFAEKVDYDEAIPALLMGPIASRYFNIRPKANPMMSMLQSLMA